MIPDPGKAIHIVTAADERFAHGLTVTVASALVSIPPERPTTVHILDGGLTPRTIGRLEKMAERIHKGSRLAFYPVKEEKFAGFKAGIQNSRMYYARLGIGSLVPADRAIYLDADVVVLGGLPQLWELDMQEKMILAAEDRKILRLREDCPWPLPDPAGDAPYFNTGVMLMDLRKWRQAGAESRAMKLAGDAGEKCQWYDQTIINYMLQDRIGKFPAAWNWQFEALPEDGAVQAIHFTTGKKPWLYRGPDARFRIWRAYYEFVEGFSLPIFLQRDARPGLLHGSIETLLRKMPALRAVYVRMLEAMLRSKKDGEKARQIAGTIAYFTTGPGGRPGDSALARDRAVVLRVREHLRARR
jgi:lipopolysaccharide biosynthesis glycosyltransferase